jgi:ABC-type transport system involved in multi-copper enzyme maturation permease subunit
MTWVTWRQYRYQGMFAAALFAVVAVVLIMTGLHATWVWHSALVQCTRNGTCASLTRSGLSLGSSLAVTLVVATAAVPVLPGLLWGAPAVARELETGTHQLAWTQGITRRRWLAVRIGWLLLAAAVLAGALSIIVTWWSRPFNALDANAFLVNHFDVTGIVPVAYAIFAMALGLSAGTVLRRTLPALAATLAGFAGVRVFVALWLRTHYMTPVTVYYKLTAPFIPAGSYLPVRQGFVGPDGRPAALDFAVPNYNGVPLPAACQQVMKITPNPQGALSCLAAHGYRGSLIYQPASRFWAFQGIETGIFLILAAALIGIAFWVLHRRDA